MPAGVRWPPESEHIIPPSVKLETRVLENMYFFSGTFFIVPEIVKFRKLH